MQPDPRLMQAITSAAEQQGAHVIHVHQHGTATKPVLEVFLDTEEGVSIELCAQVSRRLKEVIETETLLDSGFRLEVSSPGLDRPLLFPWQYRKHVGRDLLARCRTSDGVVDHRGRLEAADGEGVTLVTTTGTLRLPFADIVEARVQAPW
jgi:ribosome maturation factor RimP